MSSTQGIMRGRAAMEMHANRLTSSTKAAGSPPSRESNELWVQGREGLFRVCVGGESKQFCNHHQWRSL